MTYGLGLAAGAVLFFLLFGTVFVGSWLMLAMVLLGYAGAGAVGVRAGRLAPTTLATLLAAPAALPMLWLFPASVVEEGLARALLWPGLVLLGWALAWAGGKAASRLPSRRPA